VYVSGLSHFLGRVSKSSLGYRRILVFASTKNVSDPVINLVLFCTILYWLCMFGFYSVSIKTKRTRSIYLLVTCSKQ
jgi:hypothetical protein